MQAALAVSFLAGVWTIAVFLTGGLVIEIGSVRISSRHALNPAIAALLAAISAYSLATVDQRRQFWPALRSFARGEPVPPLANRIAVAIVLVAAVSAVWFGLARGLFVAAASDAYGYVSQADLWARGELIVRQPWAHDMTWPNADDSLAPLGYRPLRPAEHGTDIVPIYSPGVPMLMAVFKLLAGPRAVYYVVPLVGGSAVWITFLLGRRLAGPFVGAAASVLLATSPTFLFEVTAPASDIVATAWWSLALFALMFESRGAAFGAGLATGLAILARPNVAPLALVLAAPIVWRIVRSPLVGKRQALTRLALFGLGSVPACALIALLNSTLYGSSVSSGYGSLDTLYRWSHAWANLARYPRWLVETHTPVVLLAAASPLVLASSGAISPRATAVFWLCCNVALFVLYVFYLPFDEWWYLRFLMPMFPALFVLMSATILWLTGFAERVLPKTCGLVAAAVVAALGWHGVSLALDRGAANVWEAEQRYAEAGAYITSALPERAALLSMQHSGSARFYSGRITVRYDAIGAGDLDRVLDELRRLGYRPYFLLDDWEEANFRRRFSNASSLGRLDWAPKAQIHRRMVRLYDPADRR